MYQNCSLFFGAPLKAQTEPWFNPSLITAKPCMESVNRQYGINAKRCMESSRKKCTIGDAIRLRQFHTRQSVMPYQAYALNKNNLNCPFRFNLGYFWCGRQDLNLHGEPPDPKSGASANSATPALFTRSVLIKTGPRVILMENYLFVSSLLSSVFTIFFIPQTATVRSA